jgi:thioredoxin-like negative regulator of GroEL
MFELLSLLPSLCAPSEEIVLNLTSPGFRDYVLKRDETTIWMILFVALSRKSCLKALREFRKAAVTASSLARFAVVNLTEEPFLQRRLAVDFVPLVKIYHPAGSDDYTGK